MKKLCIAMCLALVSIGVNAQKGFSWETNAGMNVAKFNWWDSKIGYHFGVRGKMSLEKGLYANAGVFLSAKGASLDFGDLGDEKIHANYLEIPIHVGLQYDLNDKFRVFGEFGPYFAYGLFGKTKVHEFDFDYDYNPIKEESSYNTFGDGFKRFDTGLGFRFGAELSHKYIFAIGYDFGLINLYKEGENEDEYEFGYEEDIDITGTLKNRNLYISLGYRF